MIQNKAIVYARIQNEITLAEKAMTEGNIGRARVCARRGAGLAISYWRAKNNYEYFDGSAMTLLRLVDSDENIPLEIRKTVNKLISKVSEINTKVLSSDPLGDCKVIVDFFMN